MSTSTRHTAAELAREVAPLIRRMLGGIRKMVVELTGSTANSAPKGSIWTVRGYDGVSEKFPAEVYSNVGFYSRPPDPTSENRVQTEAVVVNGGDAKNPMIVATRDERTRKASVGDLAPDESAMHNSQAKVHVKADGTIEACSVGGTAVELATKADLEALKAAIQGWVVSAGDGGAALKAALTTLFTGPPTWPAGTTKLKGE